MYFIRLSFSIQEVVSVDRFLVKKLSRWINIKKLNLVPKKMKELNLRILLFYFREKSKDFTK